NCIIAVTQYPVKGHQPPKRKNPVQVACTGKILRQHRTIWQEHSVKDFASYESYERAGILYVFPPFITARMVQKIGRRPQTQLCGDALNLVISAADEFPHQGGLGHGVGGKGEAVAQEL